MRQSMNQFKDLLRAKIECIWIDTYEEEAALKDIKEVLNELSVLELHGWSHTEGLRKLPLTNLEKAEEPNPKLGNPRLLFEEIKKNQSDEMSKKESVYVLKDLHLLIGSHEVKRLIRDLKESPSRNYNPIVVISPVVDVPIELEKLFTIISFDVPQKAEIEKIVAGTKKHIDRAVIKGRDLKSPSEEQVKKLVNACIGLTAKEIADVFAKSLVKYKELSLQAVMEEKIQLVKKSGVLDYIVPSYSFDDIGGNNAFKTWVEEMESSYSEEAIAFGCEAPKGYLALGIPGTAKSVGAEAIAHKWGVPLLKLSMERVMDKLVGQSERKIDQAFRVAKACAPCVFLWDEVEKMLGGIKSSNGSDSGTTARVFGKCLEFLANNSDVFVVMTSNDVSQLPPEFTRSGRLDAMWYFSLPTLEERKEIFRIHFEKTKREVSEELLSESARASENLTGAEIKEVVKIAMRKAYKRFKTDGDRNLLPEDVRGAVNEIIPLYKSSKEKILALESWSKGRARSSNYIDSLEITTEEDEILESLLF